MGITRCGRCGRPRKTVPAARDCCADADDTDDDSPPVETRWPSADEVASVGSPVVVTDGGER